MLGIIYQENKEYKPNNHKEGENWMKFYSNPFKYLDLYYWQSF